VSITLDEDLHARLRRAAGPRGVRRFVEQTLRERLSPRGQALYREYLAASRDPDRLEVLEDWDALETEAW
jgi:Arc/MetJ family transcription regulator